MMSGPGKLSGILLINFHQYHRNFNFYYKFVRINRHLVSVYKSINIKMADNLLIDNLDKKILDIITKNARIPYLEVARECGVSGAAIHQRVQRLIRIGVIRGSEFKVDPVMVGFKTCAYIGIFLDHPGHFREVIDKFREIPEIIECHYTTGNYSLFIKVYTRDNEHLRMILTDTIQNISGIVRTETLISLEESINRQIPVLSR
jgi:Lrp/AsnC family transcriptional regulator, regulator for asnA, asnC and gidA